MLTIVIEKPIQFTIVNAEPFESSGALCATNVENKGESAITTSPQKNKNKINKRKESDNKKNGDNKQHKQERKSEMVAIFFAP